MREEIIKICEDLKKWCEKYNKNYYNISYINGNIMTSANPGDIDYNELTFFINDGFIYSQEELMFDNIKNIQKEDIK